MSFRLGQKADRKTMDHRGKRYGGGMAIVLTTGFPRSKPEFVHSVLSHAGLEDASPCVKTELSPTAITSRTLADLKVDAADWENVRQINPSKLCQALTVDLAIANLNKQNWGWADPNNIRLLNFWYNFDPQTRFCLVYTSPEMVAANLSATEPITARSLQDMLEQWRIYNEELLAFYNRHNARCVLVNFDVLAQPRKLLDICDQKLGVQLSGGEQKCENASTDHAIERLAIRTLLGGSHRFEPLYQELESCADLPAFANIALDELAAIASDQHRLLKKEIADNSELIGLMSAERDNQKKANELLSVQLRRVHEQLERVCLRLQITEKRIRSLVDPDGGSVSWSEAPFWLQKLKMQIEGDAKEKEILANQLRKSREEQESYKRLCLNQKATTEQSSERNVTYPIVVDLRQPIIGDNWYDVEADGRWAGSETGSRILSP